MEGNTQIMDLTYSGVTTFNHPRDSQCDKESGALYNTEPEARHLNPLIASKQSSDSEDEDNHNAKFINNVNMAKSLGYADIEKMRYWEKQEEKSQCQEQAYSDISNMTDGEKFRIVVTMGMGEVMTVVSPIIDSGSFTSCMSEEMARSLGGRPFPVRPTMAKAANGSIWIEKHCRMRVDLGPILVDMVFSLINDPEWKRSLCLIGNNVLRSLRVIINFDTCLMYINGTFPIKLYTDDKEANKCMEQQRNKYIKKPGFVISTSRAMTLQPKSRTELRIFLTRKQADRLRGSPAFGRQIHQCGFVIPSIYINETFDYDADPITLQVANFSNRAISVPRRQQIFALRNIYTDVAGPRNLQLPSPELNEPSLEDSDQFISMLRENDSDDEGDHEWNRKFMKDWDYDYESDDNDSHISWDQLFDKQEDFEKEEEDIIMSITPGTKRKSNDSGNEDNKRI